jgi:hypothetical protein
MEEDIKISDVEEEEFIKMYRDFAEENGCCQLVKDFTKNPSIPFNKCYWLSSATDNIKSLDEFLKLNIPDIDFYNYKSSTFTLRTDKEIEHDCNGNIYDEFIPISYYTSLWESMPYIFYSEGTLENTRLSNIKCVLKKNMTLKQANEEDIGVIMLNINPADIGDLDQLKIEKIAVYNGKLFHEKYIVRPGTNQRSVHTYVYDLNYILSRKTSVNGRDAYYTSNYIFVPGNKEEIRLPQFIDKKENILDHVTVVEEYQKPGVYKLYGYGDRSTTIIDGDSLYDAYYKYMMEQGYYINNSLPIKKKQK